MRRLLRYVVRAGFMPRLLGYLLALYLRFVWWTSRTNPDPSEVSAAFTGRTPLILTIWHGQSFLIPLFRPKDFAVSILIARNREAEIAAAMTERLGMKTVRASGAHRPQDMRRKGGMVGFRELLRTLQAGDSIALTADVPKVAKNAGTGILMLAQHSGRPILPVAAVASRSINIGNWDKTTVPLPFSRIGFAIGEPIQIAGDAGEAGIEAARQALTASLNLVTGEAYARAGVRSKFATGAGDG